MTEFSWPWACDNIGDGGSASFTLDVVEMTNRIQGNLSATSDGVIFWNDTTVLPFTGFVNDSTGLLNPTNPSGNTIRISSGIGLVQGWLYASDDNTDFDATGAANATDIIVLRRDRTGQDVRLELVQAGAGGTATVTQNATTWEVSICSIELDGSGNVAKINDLRQLVKPPVGSMTLIEEKAGTGASAVISFTNIPPLHNHILIIGYCRTDTGAVGSNLEITFNGDTGANYDSSILQAVNGAITHTRNIGANAVNVGYVTGAGGAGNAYDMIKIHIAGYTTTGGNKTLIADSNAKRDGTNGATGITTTRSDGWWQDNTAINQIDITSTPGGNFTTDSIFSLYGIV